MLLHNSFWYYFAPFLWKLGTFIWVLKKNHALAELLGNAEGEVEDPNEDRVCYTISNYC